MIVQNSLKKAVTAAPKGRLKVRKRPFSTSQSSKKAVTVCLRNEIMIFLQICSLVKTATP